MIKTAWALQIRWAITHKSPLGKKKNERNPGNGINGNGREKWRFFFFRRVSVLVGYHADKLSTEHGPKSSINQHTGGGRAGLIVLIVIVPLG